MTAIEVSHLTKEYRLGALHGARQAALNVSRRILGKPVEERPLFKALDDVSFTVDEGEVVGIIGHNGAGKSTLLKMLARISTPTGGRVEVSGRIAPLIEVGAGFVPDFTGRENVYLNCSILGMSRHDIDRKFDEIIEFAEMSEFIDTPVKRYSSGMQVKLAFAVATSVDAEILIVDEVLAVGDLAFQRKCFDRMERIIKSENTTVLVVSHNLRQIARICSRVLMLTHGRLEGDGDPATVCNSFYEYSNETIRAQHESGHSDRRLSNDVFKLDAISVIDESGEDVTRVSAGSPLKIRVVFDLFQKITNPEIVIGTHTTDFVYLTANSTDAHGGWPDLATGHHEIELALESFPFKSGVYAIRLAIFDELRQPVFVEDNLFVFQVHNENEHLLPQLRLIDAKCTWRALR